MPSACCFPEPEEMSPDFQDETTGKLVEIPGVNSLRQSHLFLNSRLDCHEEQAVDPKRRFQHCFRATATASDIPGSPEEALVPNLIAHGPDP